MKANAIHVQLEDVSGSPEPRNSRAFRLTLYTGIATIILAVPVLWTAWGRAYEISQTPDQVRALSKHQAEQDSEISAEAARQAEIREGLNRILSAMHLDPIKEAHKEDPKP